MEAYNNHDACTPPWWSTHHQPHMGVWWCFVRAPVGRRRVRDGRGVVPSADLAAWRGPRDDDDDDDDVYRASDGDKRYDGARASEREDEDDDDEERHGTNVRASRRRRAGQAGP